MVTVSARGNSGEEKHDASYRNLKSEGLDLQWLKMTNLIKHVNSSGAGISRLSEQEEKINL